MVLLSLLAAARPSFAGGRVVYEKTIVVLDPAERLGEATDRSNEPGAVEDTEELVADVPGGTAWTSATEAPGADNLFYEDFEGDFPGARWSLSGNPTWNDTSFRSYEGIWSAWCASGGTNGLNPSGPYTNSMNAWATAGPFDLSDAASGQVSLWSWIKTESGQDYFKYMLSTNGVNYSGYQIAGVATTWTERTIPFTNVPTYGNILGCSNVWLALIFTSNAATNDAGVFVDNVSIEAARPNITPYQPAGWSDGIVVSAVSGTTTGSAIYAGDIAYIDYAYINQGGASVQGRVYSEFYVNGSRVRRSYYDNQPTNVWVAAYDFEHTFPAAGTYTLELACDADNDVAESDEDDNRYATGATVQGNERPNLTPYQPAGWSDKLVVSPVTNTTTDGPLFSGQTGYVDYAYINNGSADAAETFYVELYVNTTQVRRATKDGLKAGYYAARLDVSYVFPTAGAYTVRFIADADNDVDELNEGDNQYQRSASISASGLPNLRPYQPAGWSNMIVVSSVPGTSIDGAALYPGQTSYIDYAYVNDSQVDITNTFYAELFVHTTLVRRASRSGLLQGNYAYKTDFEHVFPTAGTYTVKLVADADNHVPESNEGDNEFQRNRSVGADLRPNVTPYQPAGWSDKIVISSRSGTSTDDTIYAGSEVFVDYAYINNGQSNITGTFYTELTIGGNLVRRGSIGALNQGQHAYKQDVKYTFASAGTYTLRVVCDADGDVAESSEGDNAYQRSATVSEPLRPNLTPYQPSGWSDKIVVSGVAGTHTDGAVTAGAPAYVDYAYINNGTADATNMLYVELFVDGAQVRRASVSGIKAGYYGFKDDFAYTFTNGGTYTLKLVADADNTVAESNEADNEYERAAPVSGGAPAIRVEPESFYFTGPGATAAAAAAAPRPDHWMAFGREPDADYQPAVSLAASDADGLEIQFRTPGVTAARTTEQGRDYHVLQLGRSHGDMPTGHPDLPALRRFIHVPRGRAAAVEYTLGDRVELDNCEVYPVQEPQYDTAGAREPAFVRDEAAYARDAWLPAEPVRLDEPEILRGEILQRLTVYPFQYNPARRLLRAYPDIAVRVTFSGAERTRDERLRSPAFDRLLARFALNPAAEDAAPERPAATTAARVGADYLIISAPAFATQAQALRDHKIGRGISATVRTTADTGATSAQIKSYIQNAYNTWSPAPTYVLLLGDVETIPTTYQTTSERGTDLYYSTVDGSDYVPDLFLGRISVDTAAQADIAVRKIIAYENDPPTRASFYQKAAMVGYFQDDNKDGYADRRFLQTCEETRAYLAAQGYTVQRIYYTKSTVTPRYWNKGTYASGQAIPAELLRANGFAWDGDAADIAAAINGGAFLVMHRDHGMDRNGGYSATGWGDPRFTQAEVAQLANGEMLPVVLSVNCQSGWFDGETDHVGDRNYESFCELLLRRENGGAIAVFGSTRNSISGYNDFMAMGFLDSAWPGFLTGAANASGADRRLGAMLVHGKFAMDQLWGDRWGNRKMEYELFHLHGDPSLSMRTENPSSDDSFVIYNDGDADLLITNMVKRDGQAWLSFDPGAPMTIRPGQAQAVQLAVDWGAALVGGTNDRIVIYHNDPARNPYPSGVDVGIPGRPPVLRVSELSLAPSVTAGANASSLYFQVWNDGLGTMNYTVASNASWLAAVPSSGSSTGEADTLEARFQTAGLAAGNYEGTLTLAASGADRSPAAVQVHLTVHPPQPAIQRDPVSLSRTIRTGETAGDDSFEVWNSGGDAMYYTVSSNVSWLSVEPTSGLNTGARDTILIRFHTAGLGTGLHTGGVIVASAGATNSPQAVAVQVTVVAADDVYEENDSLATAYDWTYDGAGAPLNAERTWLSGREGPALQADEDWYRIRVEPGYERVSVTCLFVHADGDIDLALCDDAGTELAASRGSADGESLSLTVPAPGYYFLRIFGAGTGNEYDLWWNGFDAQAVLAAGVSSLARTADQGADADSQSYETWNGGGGDLPYEILENCPWLSVMPTNGSSAGERDEIQVLYATAALGAGAHAAVITNRARAGASNEVLLSVLLTVRPPDDPYETNNAWTTAYDLSAQPAAWLSGLGGPGVQRDDDWYRIAVPPGYENVIITCLFTHAEGDIDVGLYDAAGQRQFVAEGVADNEILDGDVPAPGTFYIRVYYDDAGNTYDLWWNAAMRQTPISTLGRTGTATGVQLQIETQPGWRYDLQYSTGLLQGAWNTLSTNAGTGAPIALPDTHAVPPRFYRVLIRSP